MNLGCNLQTVEAKPATAQNKQHIDTRSLTLFVYFLRIVKAILIRFKQAHLTFSPGGRKLGSTTDCIQIRVITGCVIMRRDCIC